MVNEGDAATAVHTSDEAPEIADATSWERAVASALADLGDPEEVLEALSAAATTANRGNAPQEQGVDAEGIEDEVEGGGVEAAATGAATPAPSPARQAMDFSRSIFTEGSDATPPAEDTPAARGRFRQRCEVIANTYLLSRRESEVMYYLARGYKSSHIQHQLYISEGTAKTHIRHIYRKLNIHSQQDLIHLIDGVEL